MLNLEDMSWENHFSLLLVIYPVSILSLFYIEKNSVAHILAYMNTLMLSVDTYQLHTNHLTLLGCFHEIQSESKNPVRPSSTKNKERKKKNKMFFRARKLF